MPGPSSRLSILDRELLALTISTHETPMFTLTDSDSRREIFCARPRRSFGNPNSPGMSAEAAKSLGIRTYEKRTRNSFRIRTYSFIALKAPWNEHLQKRGGGGAPALLPLLPLHLVTRQSEVVPATQQRAGRAHHLRQPPHPADPGLLAAHHAPAQVVEQARAHLDGAVERAGVGKRLQQRVELLAPAARDDPAGGPGIKGGCAMARYGQRIPQLWRCLALGGKKRHRPCRGLRRRQRHRARGCAQRKGPAVRVPGFSRSRGLARLEVSQQNGFVPGRFRNRHGNGLKNRPR